MVMQIHGSLPYDELRELGILPSSITDFSATVNPFPLPEAVRNLFTSDGISAYPDIECHEARSAIADHNGIPVERVLLTTGVTETIFILPELFGSAMQFAPTYGDYEAAYRRHDRPISGLPFPESQHDLDGVADALKSRQPSILIFCNPNNPDGRYVPMHRIEEWCNSFGRTMFCVDESYQEMGDACESAVELTRRCPNLLVLRSLTKPYGIGGLRMGYVVSSGGVLVKIKERLLPWGVSSIAQRLVPVLLEHRVMFVSQWGILHREKAKLRCALASIEIPSSAGKCPFFLARVRNPSTVRRYLLAHHHMAVRDCLSFGLKETLRIMPSIPENNERLVGAFEKCVKLDIGPV